MNVVGITVDPSGDTKSDVLQWLALHQEPSNFHYLIGSTSQLRPVWNAYHVAHRTDLARQPSRQAASADLRRRRDQRWQPRTRLPRPHGADVRRSGADVRRTGADVRRTALRRIER
jgi:cytochrome oxidase Cu insertion factor (SCO1/SenC/PrrC family)